MVNGYEKRQKEKLRYDAWRLANIMQPHLKKRIKPEDLIKPRKTESSDRESLKGMVSGTSEKDKDLQFLTMLKKRAENGS